MIVDLIWTVMWCHLYFTSALQGDYQKACEMADNSAHEVTDLLDQLSKKEDMLEKLRHQSDLQEEELKAFRSAQE